MRRLLRECGRAINGTPVWVEKWLVALVVILALRAWATGAL